MSNKKSDKDNIEILYIPETNEEYVPRDVQLKISIEREFLDNFPIPWNAKEDHTALVFTLDTDDMTAVRSTENITDSAVTISLRVDPRDGIAKGLNPNHPDYAPYSFSNSPIVSNIHGLSLRTNYRWGSKSGPIDEMYTNENGSYDFIMECDDPGNKSPRSCSMRMLDLNNISPSNFVLSIAVVFPYSRVSEWKAIKEKVESFVSARGNLVPFSDRLLRK